MSASNSVLHDIFISYARRDGREAAEQLDAELKAAGFKTWRDTRDIDPAQDFTAEIEVGIENAALVAVCVTPDSKREDGFVRREIQYALAIGKPVLPLRFAEIVPHVHIVTHEWLDFFRDWRAAFNRLVQLIRQPFAQQAKTTAAPPPETVDPYRDYLQALYQQIVRYLEKTVFSLVPGQSNLITLRGEDTPEAVEGKKLQALPMAFFDMAGIEAEKARGFSDFHEAFQKHNGRILLLGEPGAGKTTTLFAFARDAVSRRLSDTTQPLPLLAPIALWDAQTQPPLADWLAGAIPALGREMIAQTLIDGRGLLLLDGLDELGGEREEIETKERFDPRARFVGMFVPTPQPPPHKWRGGEGQTPLPDPLTVAQGGGEKQDNDIVLSPKNQIVISCRVKDYADLVERSGEKLPLEGAVTLQPLDDGQMQVYLRDLPGLWAALQKDDALREVARTPLLLSLFTFAFAEQPDELKKLEDLSAGDVFAGELRDAIFEQYVKRRYAHEERKYKARGEAMPFGLEEIYEVLGYAAMRDAGGQSEPNLLEPHDFRENIESLSFLTQFAVELDILFKVTVKKFRFIHSLLRDYFAYLYSLKHITNIDHYNNPYTSNPALALGAIGDKRAVQVLIQATDTYHKVIRQSLIQALGNIGDKHCVTKLLELLKDDYTFIRISVIDALAKIGDERAIPALVEMLRDEVSFVQSKAAKAIDDIKKAVRETKPTTKASELNLLHERELNVFSATLLDKTFEIFERQQAAYRLGELADSRATNSLTLALNDEDALIRKSSILALAEIGDSSTIPYLVALLSDNAIASPVFDHKICDYAAEALTRIGTPEALAAVEAWRAGQTGE